MNLHFLKMATLISSSVLMLTGCGDNSSFETPAKNGETPSNNKPVSQNNFTILFSPTNPKFFDPAKRTYTAVTAEVSVQIGDNNNQLITGSRIIHFRTEWGLIDPSCTTKDGGCKVTWRSGSPDTMPADFLNTIVAYSDGGQESYADINGNGIFDDGDTFATSTYSDLQEPFINVDESDNGFTSTFTTGDIIIDTVNGRDLTGTNTSHDSGDGLFNGPNCAHSTLCSTTRSTVTVWEDGTQLLNGGTIFSIGGTVSGLTGTLVIQINSANDLTITADGTYSFNIIAGTTYELTILTPSAGQTCKIANSLATPTADVSNANITCI